MRRCVDCNADISRRRAWAYLCVSCRHRRHLEHDRRWHHENLASGRESSRRQHIKNRKRICRACGAPRERLKWYCDLCRTAFVQFTRTLAKKKYSAKLRRAA